MIRPGRDARVTALLLAPAGLFLGAWFLLPLAQLFRLSLGRARRAAPGLPRGPRQRGLPARVPQHPGRRLRRDGRVPAPRLPDRLRARAAPGRPPRRRLLLRPRPLLDQPARPDLRVDAAPRDPGADQRRARHRRPGEPAAPAPLQLDRRTDRHGPRPLAVRDPADLRGDGEGGRPAPPRVRRARRPAGDHVPPGLPPAHAPGRDGRRGVRLPPGPRLLRHPRAPGRPREPHGGDAHRDPGERAPRLGAGGGRLLRAPRDDPRAPRGGRAVRLAGRGSVRRSAGAR